MTHKNKTNINFDKEAKIRRLNQLLRLLDSESGEDFSFAYDILVSFLDGLLQYRISLRQDNRDFVEGA